MVLRPLDGIVPGLLGGGSGLADGGAAQRAGLQPIRVWFADGLLHVGDGRGQVVGHSLDQVASIDALEVKGRVVRLLVDRKDGGRDVYAGYDDMDAFASEFRSQVRNVPFERMRSGFSGGLKEVES